LLNVLYTLLIVICWISLVRTFSAMAGYSVIRLVQHVIASVNEENIQRVEFRHHPAG